MLIQSGDRFRADVESDIAIDAPSQMKSQCILRVARLDSAMYMLNFRTGAGFHARFDRSHEREREQRKQVAISQCDQHVRFTPKADMCSAVAHVCYGPKADAPYYWITSSARAINAGGTARPSALAVLRLIARSNFVGSSTGRSPGFSPERIRAT